MKKLFIFLCVILMVSCKFEPDPQKFYIDVDCTIVSFGQPTPKTTKIAEGDRYTVILQMDDLPLQCELSTLDDVQITTSEGCGSELTLTGEWFYTHKVGDKVHFDYINRDRFFPAPKQPQVIQKDYNDDLSFYE